MKTRSFGRRLLGFGVLVLAVLLFTSAGCKALPKRVTDKGAAQLWEQNCARCHNYRDPGSLSDAKWEIAVHHMRVRGGLTAEEHKKIVAFLKASN